MSKSLISAMNKHITALDELLKRIQDPRNGIAIEDRKYHLRVYPQTFVGRELVDWLVSNQIFASRGDAVAFGKVLIERGVIRHCTQGHDFKDEYLFYVIMPSFQLLSLLQKETEKLLSERRVSIYDPSNVRIGAKKSESGKARCFKIQELIDTEKTYLRSLDVAIREYKTILMSRNDIITEAKIKQIFANIEEVIMTCHGFLRELYKRIPDEFSEATCIGQIFLAYANWTTYATYAHKHQDAIALMLELEHKNDPVVNLLKSIRDEKDVLDVMSLLIQPVQRVPRYILLLDDLLKRTPDGHPDKEPLMKAIKGVESVAVEINESIREYEMLKHVDKVLKQYGYPKELDDVHLEGSKVLAEGWLAKVTRRGPTVRRFVVIKIPKAPNGGAIYYARASLQSLPTRASAQFTLTGVRRLPVGPYFAQPIPPTQDVQFAFKLLGKGKSFICIATSEAEQKMWIQAFNHLSNTEAQSSFAPVWIGDDHSDSCLRCNKQFTAVFRRHHCRNCGILVCHKCSSKKSVVKSVHPTNPTRVCDNCYDILEGALAAAGQVTGRALGSLIFFDNNDDTEDNDDESEFERLHLSNEDLRENLMKSAAVMIQRMALTLNQQPKTSNLTSDEERRVIIGAKYMSTDSETTSERSNSGSTQNSSSNSSNRSSAELKSPGVARTRSSHVFGPNLARMTLMTPTTDVEENSTSDAKNRPWVSSGSDPNPLNRRPTSFLLSRGRSTGEVRQNNEAPSTPDSM